MSSIKIALVDDHILLRKGLVGLLLSQGFDVIFDCDDGLQLTQLIDTRKLPDVVLMDISMPVKNGYETTAWLREHFPLINVLALSMYEDEDSVIRMLRSGAKGYILKDADPSQLKAAISDVFNTGVHFSDQLNGNFLHAVMNSNKVSVIEKLNEREIAFLKLCATEMTYKEIAAKIFLSPRTIDGYRDALFEKLGVRNRIGIVLFAIKHHIVSV